MLTEKLNNARAMAEALMQAPANEQNLSQIMAATAQAIRDLADAIEDVNDYVSTSGEGLA